MGPQCNHPICAESPARCWRMEGHCSWTRKDVTAVRGEIHTDARDKAAAYSWRSRECHRCYVQHTLLELRGRQQRCTEVTWPACLFVKPVAVWSHAMADQSSRQRFSLSTPTEEARLRPCETQCNYRSRRTGPGSINNANAGQASWRPLFCNFQWGQPGGCHGTAGTFIYNVTARRPTTTQPAQAVKQRAYPAMNNEQCS
jgi:hypothetical protein